MINRTLAVRMIIPLGWVSLSGLLLFATGCDSRSDKSTTATVEQSRVFDTAPASIKQVWDQALAAEKNKDYVAAQNLFVSMGNMNLSSQQRAELTTEFSDFQQRVYNLAEKGDPVAVKAIKEIRQSSRKLSNNKP